MDPGRHHDFLGNTEDRSNRNTYYGREIPEITSHHYYGPATANTRTAAAISNNPRKPCGCAITGSGGTTCNNCRMNPNDDVAWSHPMTNANQMDNNQRTAGVGAAAAVGSSMGMSTDYHNRMVAETNLRSNVRQNTMYVQQLPHQQQTQQMQQQATHGPSLQQTQQHASQVGSMTGNRTNNYWPLSSATSSSSMHYPGGGSSGGDELISGHPSRNNPLSNDYGLYKSTSMPTNVTYANQHNNSSFSSNNNSVSGYQLPSSSLNTSNNSLHQRVSAIGSGGLSAATGPVPAPPFMAKERIYEQQKYSSPSAAATARMPYNTAPAASIYESHHHHHLNNQVIAKNLPVDHHVINPSNLPASKEQHPSPNYARKCPQMYAPEEQSTAHQHLYMSTPQFSSEKFTRASPQQPQPPPPSDYTKLRESPSGSSYLVAPHSSPLLHSSHLRESPQFPSHTTSSPRNPSSYYGASQTQNPSKIHPPEMSPIIMKQTHQTHHYQYSKSPLPPPLPPSHMQQQQTIPPNSSLMAAKSQTNLNVAPHPAPSQHSQRYLLDNVKREDLEIYENPQQTSSRNSASSSSIYINPYNTPPPTGDNCCKEVALSASSSPYTVTGSATPNYRVESPQFYPTKYAKLALNENLTSSKQHSLINQNTPPPSRAPSQRGQHQSNYYYEGNSHSAPSPAAATAASPSPSALLTTTSQTPMHHTEYMSSSLQTTQTIGPPPTAQLVGSANMPQSYTNQTNLTAQTNQMPHHMQHQPGTAALRNNDVMVQNTSSHPYERAPPIGTQPHLKMKHVTHPSSTSSSAAAGPVSALQQMQQVSSNAAKSLAKHQKPNYRELINQKLAMRNATSEEELNMQIIKKTLNVDTQNMRQPPPPPANINQQPLTGNKRGTAAMPTPQLQANERMPASAAAIREPNTSLKQTAPVLISHGNAALTMPTKARLIDLPEAIPQRICIKQEDAKPSSSTSSTTSSSPLDLSMRTVKTKADSTDYKYQQRPRLPTSATSTTSSEGRYTLPRVDSTPIFSVHAFEPGAVAATAAAAAVTNPSRQSNSRHTSLERRNYTPPIQQNTQNSSPVSSGSKGYAHSSTQHIPNSPTQQHYYHHHQQYAVSGNFGSTRRNDLPPLPSNTTTCYENSLVIKAAPPKLSSHNSDIVARPITITAPPAQIQRPSVVETNPFATVIKTENKSLNETPPHSPHPTIAAAERLPPDTSIMALPSRNPYGVVRTAIQTNHNAHAHITSSNSSTTPSNYTLACEKNPNFLGRKRHLQEYSQQMSRNEPEEKHKRYLDSMPTPTKPQIAMRPADITVIAVNDHLMMQESQEGKSNKTKAEEFDNSASVIASTTSKSPINKAKVIVNNTKTAVTNCSPTSSSGLVVGGMVCKQEPLTPTQENTNLPGFKTNEMPTNSFSSRIRTKAELKGFTFNPPLPPTQFLPDNDNTLSANPNKLITIKQEEREETGDLEELIPAEKIKEEIVTKIELPPTIPGLDDDYEDKSLLDLGWSKTCNSFVEQLLSRPLSKKKISNFPLLNASKTVLKENEMQVTSSEAVISSTTTKVPLDNHSLSNMESADNTTRSSFNRLDAGVESSITLNNLNQDSINSPGGSTAFQHKKLSKTEREKKRFQQEKRLAERLKAKESSSETEDELDKRKTERLKKPNMKTKHKLKSSPKTGNTTNSNTSSSNGLKDKSHFSDCGSDTSSTDHTCKIKLEIKQEQPEEEEEKAAKDQAKLEIKSNEKCDINEQDQDKKEDDKFKKKPFSNNNKKSKEEKSVIKKVLNMNKKKETKQRPQEAINTTSSNEEEEEEEDKNKPDMNSNSKQQTKNKQALNTKTRSKCMQETNNSSNTSEEEDEEESLEKNENDTNSHSKQTKNKQALNTMTRSKRKQELEQQLANSKVLRNDKVIRNFSNANSTNKIKRKYTRKYNTVNSLLESGGLSRESGIMKSTRLKAKLEKNGGKLNLIKTNQTKSNNKKLDGKANPENKTRPENVHERNVIDLYRFKRALKVPPSLINIKHPGNHKIAASLPDLERHAEALEAYAKKREKKNLKTQNKLKTSKTTNSSSKHTKPEKATTNKKLENQEPKSIIDLLHSRVTNASGVNVRNKTTTTTANYRLQKSCCSITMNNLKTPLNNSSNNCGMFSETSQTTESSELQMLPELKKDSDLEEDNEDNESNTNNGGKKRHFSIFDTKVLPAKTRTESKLQQKKENIREIFVGDDRPASAPLPEMTQILDSNEKITYEQKYEQFLQQMNIVVSADTLGRLGRATQKKKLPHTHSMANGNPDIRPEEVDTESTSVIDADELKEDHQKILPNHFRKRRGKYLRRKGSSGFDYIRKKKKPSTATNSAHHNNLTHHHLHHHNHFNHGPFGRNEMYDLDEYEHKIKTEDDVSREIQKWVLNKGVGQSAMHKAARQGYIDVIVYCLDRLGMNPDQKDNAGYTPLHEACTNGWLNIARVLLQYGANHSEAAHSGIRPLHEASENDHEEVVRLLLSYGADPLLATYAGQTPLMLASSKAMRDILSNHLIDVQSMGPERKPWRFNGSWEIYDPSECGYNVFEGAPNSVCDMSRALLRKSSLNNNQIYQNNKKQLNVLHNNNSTNTINATATTTTTTFIAAATTTTTQTLTNNFSLTSTSSFTCQSANNSNNNNNKNDNHPSSSTSRTTLNCSSSSGGSNSISTNTLQSGSEAQQQQQQPQLKSKGETNTKTVMEKCAVVLDNIDRFNSVRLNNDNKPEILVENSDSDGEMFEFEEADVLLPPLYLLKDEGTQDKWVLLNDLCNLLKVKSKDTLLNKIYPSTTSSSSASAASAHKSHMRELKMSDFLEKATCLQLLCAGEKLNICASKVVLIKYNENVRNLLGVKTILMKF